MAFCPCGWGFESDAIGMSGSIDIFPDQNINFPEEVSIVALGVYPSLSKAWNIAVVYLSRLARDDLSPVQLSNVVFSLFSII